MFYLKLDSQEDAMTFLNLEHEQAGKIIKKLLFPFLEIQLTFEEDRLYNKLFNYNKTVKENNKAKVVKGWKTKKSKSKDIKTSPLRSQYTNKYNYKQSQKTQQDIYTREDLEGVNFI